MIPLTVFITGAAVMVLELLGSRILAPFVGSSLLVWTNLIGVIMASLSCGYWLGGRLADRSTKRSMMGRILILAAAWIALIRFFHEPVLFLLQQTSLSLHWQALLGGIILFTVPSTLLAMISPYAVRLTLRAVDGSGSTVGRLSALATLGSIVGTFSAGLWLIPSFGTNTLLLILGMTLLILALPIIAHRPKELLLWTATLLLSLAAARFPSFLRVTEFDTAYSHIWIQDTVTTAGQPVRFFRQNHDFSSGMYRNDPNALLFPYTQAYDLAFSYQPAISRALMLGGAAYSYPKYYLTTHPQATMDVVEIDPAVTDLARRYFALPDNPRLHIFHQDARIFLNTATTHYNAIFVDAFNSDTIPFHLTTREAVAGTKRLLTTNGLVVMNIIASMQGDASRFLWAEYATYREQYPAVTVYQVDPTTPLTQTQNIILIAHTGIPTVIAAPTNPRVAAALHSRVDQPTTVNSPLTDDYAPVEYLVAHAVTNVVQ